MEQNFGFTNYFKFGVDLVGQPMLMMFLATQSYYEALLMFNNYVSGDMMEVENTQVKRHDIPVVKIVSTEQRR